MKHVNSGTQVLLVILTCKILKYQYRYRNFSAGWYQYRIGIEKSGIEGLCSIVVAGRMPYLKSGLVFAL